MVDFDLKSEGDRLLFERYANIPEGFNHVGDVGPRLSELILPEFKLSIPSDSFIEKFSRYISSSNPEIALVVADYANSKSNSIDNPNAIKWNIFNRGVYFYSQQEKKIKEDISPDRFFTYYHGGALDFNVNVFFPEGHKPYQIPFFHKNAPIEDILDFHKKNVEKRFGQENLLSGDVLVYPAGESLSMSKSKKSSLVSEAVEL